MRTMKLYRHGLTIGTSVESNHKRGARGECLGWSASASRNNLKFLRSIDERFLDVTGYRAWAVTLTVRNCPETSNHWKSIRESLFKRFRRKLMLRAHWVTEWQRRGVPHLHIAVWLPEGITPSEIIKDWLDLTGKSYGAKLTGQYVLPITEAVGWFKYVAKHTARGASHYQRSPESIPKGWEKTGRVWGKIGDWPIGEAHELALSDKAFYRIRRITKNWRVANSRNAIEEAQHKAIAKQPQLESSKGKALARIVAKGEIKRLKQARAMLKNNDQKLSNVRGSSEWINHKISWRFYEYLEVNGFIFETI